MTEAKYYSLSISIHRLGESYQVELSHTDPTSQAKVAPLRGSTTLDLDKLLSLQLNHADYGKALAGQLFSDQAVAQRFAQVETATQTAGSFLRILLCIDHLAQELQALRWELLRHPKTNALLSTSETLLLSRFMVSRDWRPVRLRARTELKALIVVSAPAPTKSMTLAPVDFESEVRRIKTVLKGLEVNVLGGPDAPVTLNRLLDELRGGVDIVYLASHGMFGRQGTPALILQDDQGEAKAVKGEDLTTRIAELQTGPRLVVLASCQSGGDGQQVTPDKRTTVQATLAGRLADAGVPAVLAMQGSISMATVEAMMPVFFTELLRDGQIDRALAVARGKVRAHDDAWMPALYTRLLTGRIWHTPDFTSGEDRDPKHLRTDLKSPARAQLTKSSTPNGVTPTVAPATRSPDHAPLEHPGDVVAPSSPYYVERPGDEDRWMGEVLAPSSLIRIKGPKQMGKTSLMVRLLAHARASGLRTVTVNLQMAERTELDDLDRFLRWLCAVIGRQLQVRARPSGDDWDDVFGAKDNCTAYFEDHFLSGDEDLVLALDHIDRVFESGGTAEGFLALLRAWHEMGKSQTPWDQLRMILVHTTEIYLPMDINHSPFNVGLPVTLSEWDSSMVRELASRHGPPASEANIDDLMSLLNGHPHLIRLALYHLASGMSQAELLETAATDQGIFADHLKHLLWQLKIQPELRDAAAKVMTTDQPVSVGTEIAFKLASLGLVHLQRDHVIPARELYRRYFSERLS